MKVFVSEKCRNDLAAITDQNLLARVEEIMGQIENSYDVSDIPNLEKLKENPEINLCQIQTGDFRIILSPDKFIEPDDWYRWEQIQITFMRFLGLNEVYDCTPYQWDPHDFE